ncbi:GatB/YqeY domain-containing protein [Streptomyces sanyensis]|uniref:GatB/YqeY domain-containing protein n=2 Tax=Streptomyces TaxID=1883 RepID=A0ABP9AJI2_9ACTN
MKWERGPLPPPATLGAMTTLKSTLQEDLTEAIRARDELRSSTLRLTLAAITKEEVSGKTARELSDDEVQKVIAREAKKRREAADAFAQGGRAEQAERERAEGVVLDAYLPQQLTDEELSGIVAQAVGEAKAAGAEGPRAMGAVMKIVNPKVAGRAEGGRVAAAVKRALAG